MKIKNNLVLILPILPFVLSSCGKKEEPRKEKPHDLGKYLYLTDNNVLHTEKNCVSMYDVTDEGSSIVNGMKFIITQNFVSDPNIFYCKWCFDDEYYEMVQGISNKNKYEQYKVK